MNDNTAKLLALIQNNPDLPVVCMVDCDIVCDGDDGGRWLASIGDCEVGEYVIYKERYYNDREEFKEVYYDYNDEILDERFGYNPMMAYPDALKRYKKEDIEANNAAEEILDKYLEEVANKSFQRAILVCIDLPSDVEEVKDEKY